MSYSFILEESNATLCEVAAGTARRGIHVDSPDPVRDTANHQHLNEETKRGPCSLRLAVR
jgi:hypothetical protein